MNPSELAAARRLLMLSSAEAARWVAADPERPRGVEERTWNRWESGKLPVPANIAASMLALLAQRAALLERLAAPPAPMELLAKTNSAGQITGLGVAPAHGEPHLLLWYSDPEDHPDGPLHARIDASAKAALFAAGQHHSPPGVRLVPFDGYEFARWRIRTGQEDTPVSRARWAAEIHQVTEADEAAAAAGKG